jgi:hypothetical protein
MRRGDDNNIRPPARNADFYQGVDFKCEYTCLTVGGTEKVNNRDA